MLVLSRQRDESIFIGDNIKITVVDIRGDRVRLGIEAPTEIPVHRQEVYEAIQRESQRRAATPIREEHAVEERSGTANTLVLAVVSALLATAYFLQSRFMH
jgi:carbon storage regulator